ncbi:WG repeat-containing protein, partial [Ruminococcaceae bacterium OttesenSCG-928-A16]|nr:WG repeat-containing protein [Ruminococcaceae bacterium OttesenSCG-928-A16]
DAKEIAFRNNRAFGQTEGGYVMLNETGAPVTDTLYEEAFVFLGEGAAAVKTGGKWGFVAADGQLLIAPQYNNARSFSNGLAAVQQGDAWGFINENGEMVIEARFEDARDFNDQGSAFVKEEGSWKLLKLYSKNH